ncbi:MAG: NAD(P)H-binding protein [Micromonosporaceae bacterium]|nr:NAD(P)H-binding protein [Micromonosporaceae bacterium]
MILVTGATGTVGRELVQQLASTGCPVRALVRDPAKLGDLADRVQVHIGDLDDPATLRPAMAGVARVFLLTSATRQDAAVLAAAKAAGATHIVKLSTQEAGWVPVEGHGHWHREREQLIQASGLAWTFLRPTMFMDTALQWAATVRAQQTIYFPVGDARLAPVDPADVAAVAAAALTGTGHAGNGYELTGGQLLSGEELASTLGEVLGQPIRYVDVPESAMGEQMHRAGLPGYVVDGLLETFRLVRAGRFGYTTQLVEQVTGRPPGTFRRWCERHRAAFA